MSTPNPAPIGRLLRQQRTAAALSQEELAERAGLSARAVSDLERGVHQAPRLETVRLLADALALSEADRAELLAVARPHVTAPVHRERERWHPPALLPVPPTRLIGRETEVAAVAQLLAQDEVRLVTLTGPGGIGKTRLALKVAAELLEAFTEGVYFIPLAVLTNPTLVPSAIASALGMREAAERSLIDQLRDVLAARHVLLVLDSVEHLVEATPLVGELLSTAPGLKVLTTSRMPLRLRAEREYPVSPLALPPRDPPPPPEQLAQYEAVRLFIDRAQAVKPDFTVDQDNAPAVVEICHRLDGLPLAIELAATRVRLLPPQVLAARLERRLPLLTGGARDAPARQRTLRDAIAWSYDLLTPEDQTLFRHLSVFAEGWTLDAAEVVTNPNGQLDVLEGLERLVERSFIRWVEASPGELRFAMLETIQEYGLEQLAGSGEEAETRERHAAWVLRFTDEAEPQLFRAEQRTWWQRLEAERANIRAALAWFEQRGDAERAQRLAGALWLFSGQTGRLREGQDWLRRALAIPGETSAAARAWALIGASALAWFRGDVDVAGPLAEEGLAVARAGEFALGVAVSLFSLALIRWMQGDLERALALGEEVIARLREVGDPAWLANTLNDFGTIALLQGDRERGEAWSSEGLALNRALGNRWFTAIKLSDLGIVAQRRGDLMEARRLYGESARMFCELGDIWLIASPLAGLASIAVANDYPEIAARLLGVAAKLREASGSTRWSSARERDEQTLTAARAALGEEGYARAVMAGRAMPLAQVVDEAIAIINQAGFRPSADETS